MKRLSAILPLLGILVFAAASGARCENKTPLPLHFSSRFWPIEHAQPYVAVQAIAQTADGYLWVGTQGGLARFDGHHFEFIGASNLWINALCASQNGDLWIGTRSLGLLRYTENQFFGCALPAETYSNILCLHETKNGSLWCGTINGLIQLKDQVAVLRENGDFHPARPKDLTLNCLIRSLAEDALGNVWVSSLSEIFSLDGEGRITRLAAASGRSENSIRAMCWDRAGNLWLGANGGLLRIHGAEYKFFSKKDGLPDSTVTALHEDRRGQLWVGTFGGLCRLENNCFVPEGSNEGEPYGPIFCFFEDREGSLWAGTKDGLHQFNQQKFFSLQTRQGLANNNVMAISGDSSNAMWISTWGGGLQHFERGTNLLYSADNNLSLKSDLILALADDHQGGVWFSADYNGGLYHLAREQIKHFDEQQHVSSSAIRAILKTDNGALWLATAADGLQLFNTDTVMAQYTISNGLPANSVRCLCQTRDGSIWIGTEKGLACWKNHALRNLGSQEGIAEEPIFSLFEDSGQTLWIGSAHHGLYRYANGKFHGYAARDGLPENTIVEILEDDSSHLWLGCYGGVFEIARQEFEDFDSHKINHLSGTLYGKRDGMSSSICLSTAKPAAWKTPDGRVWFVTAKGLAVTDPSLHLKTNSVEPPIVLQKVTAGGREIALRPVKSAIPEFAPGQSDFAFHYAALSYLAPEENRYRYRLSGADSGWIEAGTRQDAFYNNLGPGKYVFQAIGANNDGGWNAVGVSYPFILLPHFWQTWWFTLLSIAAILSLMGESVRQITKKRMQRKLGLLEQQHAVEKERSRIARDIHDDIGAKLTKITFLGGIAKQRISQPDRAAIEIEKISQTARELIGTLDEIVWAVDPGNDSLENFANYLCRYASEFFEDSPVLCELKVPHQIANVPLSADIRHNLFLAQKEALTNVLRHSKANQVLVELLIEPTRFQLVIRDNGIGIEVHSSSVMVPFARTGNGLRNMRERLGSIGGSFSFQRAPQKGTKIIFIVPLNRKNNG